MRANGRGDNSKSNTNAKRYEGTGVEVRCYTKKEYARLSHNKRKEPAELRNKPNDNGHSNSSVPAIKQQFKDDIKDLEDRLIAAINTANSGRASSNEANSKQPLSNLFSQREFLKTIPFRH